MSEPRVLFIADKFGYPGGVAMGGTTYFLNVIPALRAAGVDIHSCILREPHPLAKPLESMGLAPQFLSASRANPFVLHKLVALVREHRCNVLHASGIKATLMARVAARLTDARVIVHVHDQKHTGFLFSGLHRLFSNASDKGLCVSSAVRATAIAGYHLQAEQIHVIPNGIHLAEYRAAAASGREKVRRELAIAPEQPVLGMFARMYPVKGHRTMLAMLPHIIEDFPDVVLLVAGNGPERPACEAIVEKLSIERNVRFLGHRADIPLLMEAIDLFLMPSKTEGLPLAAIEALALGRPVVGFDVGGMAEVVAHGETGFLFAHGDTDSFTAAVVQLLRNREERESFGARARISAERFSVGRHVQELIEMYRAMSEVYPPDAGSGF